MRRPRTNNEIKKWLQLHGLKVKIKKVRNNTKVYWYKNGYWELLFDGEINTKDSILCYFIGRGVPVDWNSERKEPNYLIEVYEWLHRQGQQNNFCIYEDIGHASVGMGLHMRGIMKVVNIKAKHIYGFHKQIPCNYIYGGVVVQSLIDLGVKPDWI